MSDIELPGYSAGVCVLDFPLSQLSDNAKAQEQALKLAGESLAHGRITNLGSLPFSQRNPTVGSEQTIEEQSKLRLGQSIDDRRYEFFVRIEPPQSNLFK